MFCYCTSSFICRVRCFIFRLWSSTLIDDYQVPGGGGSRGGGGSPLHGLYGDRRAAVRCMVVGPYALNRVYNFKRWVKGRGEAGSQGPLP